MHTPLLDWLRDAPLWQAGGALLLWLLAAREAGNWIRRRHDARHPVNEQHLTETGFLVSAILGLLALLIGFTFSLALNRFEARQVLVQQEASALSTFADRQLSFTNGAGLTPLLAEYARARLDELNGHDDSMAKVDALGATLWRRSVAVTKAQATPPLEPFLLAPLNEAYDSAAAQRMERQRRIEASVLALLIVYAGAATLTLGLTAPGRPQRGLAIMLSLLLTMSLLAILDLDRPNSGQIRQSDRALRTVLVALEGEMAARAAP